MPDLAPQADFYAGQVAGGVPGVPNLPGQHLLQPQPPSIFDSTRPTPSIFPNKPPDPADILPHDHGHFDWKSLLPSKSQALIGLLGGAAAGTGAYYMNRNRKRRREEPDDIQKSANLVSDTLGKVLNVPKNLFQTAFPNATGVGKGSALAYSLLAAPAGYIAVNNATKGHSEKALLRKAMQERERLQAASQPPEIYATPDPRIEEEDDDQ